MRENPPPPDDSSKTSSNTGPITVEPVVPIERSHGAASSRDERSKSELRLGLAPSQVLSAANGGYSFLRNEPGAVAATTAISSSSETGPADPASSGDSRRWSLVPSPVIDVDGLNKVPARSARPFSTTVSGLQPVVLGPDVSAIVMNDQGSPGLSDTASQALPSHSAVAADGPVFNPRRAYPNAPSARPFIAGSQPLRVTGELLPAHAWKFRFGIMIVPAVGACLAAAIVIARLPMWLWAIAGTCVWFGLVAMGVLLHRAWSSIHDQHARTTPAKAIGLLFVPILNVYWAFNVIPGFATDYNQFIERHQIEARPISRNLLLAAMVPVIGIVFCWIGISTICRGINSIRSSASIKSTKATQDRDVEEPRAHD